MPAVLSARGLVPEQVGLALGACTAVRLLTAPLAGPIGDLIQALRIVLVVSTALAASVTLGYLTANGCWILVGMRLLHAASFFFFKISAAPLDLPSSPPPPSTD